MTTPSTRGAGSVAPPSGRTRNCRAVSLSLLFPLISFIFSPSSTSSLLFLTLLLYPVPMPFDILSRFHQTPRLSLLTAGASDTRATPRGTASRWSRCNTHPLPLRPGPQPRPAALWRLHSWSTAVHGDCFLSVAVIMGNFLSATQKLKPKQHREGGSRSWCTRQARGRGPGVEGGRSPEGDLCLWLSECGVPKIRVTGCKSRSLDAACSVLRCQRNLCPLGAAQEGGERDVRPH